jgi:hypothetical protein
MPDNPKPPSRPEPLQVPRPPEGERIRKGERPDPMPVPRPPPGVGREDADE